MSIPEKDLPGYSSESSYTTKKTNDKSSKEMTEGESATNKIAKPILPREERVQSVKAKIKEKVKKAPPDSLAKTSLKQLGKELGGKAEKKKLTKIQNEHAKTTHAARGAPPQSLIRLEKVAQSQNPITKIDTPAYIRKNSINAILSRPPDISLPKIKEAYLAIYRKTPGAREKSNLAAVGTEIFTMFEKSPGTPAEKVAKAVERLKQELNLDIETLTSFGQTREEAKEKFTHWTGVIEALEQFIVRPSLENIPVQYDKTEVINSLRLQLSVLPGKENHAALENAIRNLNAYPDLFIDRNFLETFPGVDLKKFEKNLNEYVSATDFLIHNPMKSAKNIVEILSATKLADQPGFAFKVGLENTRELLAGRILGNLGLDKYVVEKTELTLPGAELAGIKTPKGIAGKWLEGGREFPIKEWKALMKARQELAVAKFKQKPTDIFEQRVKEAEQKILSAGGIESIQNHVLIDALLCSYDSHPDQYMQMPDGQFYNYDFARFFAPSSTLVREGFTHATLRSAFLDHPAMNLPMKPEMVETVKSWDIGKIERDFNAAGLLANADFFERAQKRINEFSTDRSSALKSERGLLEDLCRKYNIAFTDQEAEKELRAKVEPAIRKASDEVTRECYSKIHPKAFAEFKERVEKLKEYVSLDPKPTMAQAFAKMYPDLNVFLRVLERLEDNPGSSIGVGQDFILGRMAFRSLESIVKEAETLKLASEDELSEMRQAIERMRAKSLQSETIGLTMNVFI